MSDYSSKERGLFVTSGKYSLYINSALLAVCLYIGLVNNDATSIEYIYCDLSWEPIYNMRYSVAIDGLSYTFLMLTLMLIPACILVTWYYIKINYFEYALFFVSLSIQLIAAFSIIDILSFYIFFESILIPIFIIIGIWGSRKRKISASYKLMLYTMGGSVLMLLALINIYYTCGTGDIYIVLYQKISSAQMNVLWFCFFIAFAVKVPLFPLHLWLPEAHVEAPTGGSIILAGMLLKLGTYGILRYLVGFLSTGLEFYQPLLISIAAIGIVYVSLTTMRQFDIKKLVAYSSVGHMCLVTLGLIVSNLLSLTGAVIVMIAHGFVSSGLFAFIGSFYERTHTRILYNYKGCASLLPLFSLCSLILAISNFSIPGSVPFVGEILLLSGIFIFNPCVTFICCLGLFACAAFTLKLYGLMFYGKFAA